MKGLLLFFIMLIFLNVVSASEPIFIEGGVFGKFGEYGSIYDADVYIECNGEVYHNSSVMKNGQSYFAFTFADNSTCSEGSYIKTTAYYNGLYINEYGHEYNDFTEFYRFYLTYHCDLALYEYPYVEKCSDSLSPSPVSFNGKLFFYDVSTRVSIMSSDTINMRLNENTRNSVRSAYVQFQDRVLEWNINFENDADKYVMIGMIAKDMMATSVSNDLSVSVHDDGKVMLEWFAGDGYFRGEQIGLFDGNSVNLKFVIGEQLEIYVDGQKVRDYPMEGVIDIYRIDYWSNFQDVTIQEVGQVAEDVPEFGVFGIALALVGTGLIVFRKRN